MKKLQSGGISSHIRNPAAYFRAVKNDIYGYNRNKKRGGRVKSTRKMARGGRPIGRPAPRGRGRKMPQRMTTKYQTGGQINQNNGCPQGFSKSADGSCICG